MDAERALRIQRVEVPRIKALAVREGPILFAEGKGKPYVVDPVALKVHPFLPSPLPSLRCGLPLHTCICRAVARLEVLATGPARSRSLFARLRVEGAEKSYSVCCMRYALSSLGRVPGNSSARYRPRAHTHAHPSSWFYFMSGAVSLTPFLVKLTFIRRAQPPVFDGILLRQKGYAGGKETSDQPLASGDGQKGGHEDPGLVPRIPPGRCRVTSVRLLRLTEWRRKCSVP